MKNEWFVLLLQTLMLFAVFSNLQSKSISKSISKSRLITNTTKHSLPLSVMATERAKQECEERTQGGEEGKNTEHCSAHIQPQSQSQAQTEEGYNPLLQFAKHGCFHRAEIPEYGVIHAHDIKEAMDQLSERFETDLKHLEDYFGSNAKNSASAKANSTSESPPHRNGKNNEEEAGSVQLADYLIPKKERMELPISQAWNAVEHLMTVKNSEELRKVYEQTQPKLVQLFSRASQSRPLFEADRAALENLNRSTSSENLKGQDSSTKIRARKRALQNSVTSATLQGVALEGPAKEELNKILMELAQISTTFSNNIMDSTKTWKVVLEQENDVKGFPNMSLQLASQTSRNMVSKHMANLESGESVALVGADGNPIEYDSMLKKLEKASEHEGPWTFTLDGPSASELLKHCPNRNLREMFYRRYVSRASDVHPENNKYNNGPLIARTMQLRAQKAKILGYPTAAEMSFVQKMARNAEEVRDLIRKLKQVAYPAAQKELDELRQFAHSQGATHDLQKWDVAFWSERLKEEKYGIKDEDVMPYFPLPKVLNGLFSLLESLFAISIVESEPVCNSDKWKWDPSVSFYEVRDQKTGEQIAGFTLDPYSRPDSKRGGAWMAPLSSRSSNLGTGDVRLPMAHLVCNQAPPIVAENGTIVKPSLMSIRDVETLFHETGHGLQQMLTSQTDADVSGINGIEWDAVELPSQFMEGWIYVRSVMNSISGHMDSGEPLPDSIFQQLQNARHHMTGLGLLRQLEFASLDLELHAQIASASLAEATQEDMKNYVNQIRSANVEEFSLLDPLPEDRFLNAFMHIFAGPYACGYYSYAYAEVLSADAFQAFEEVGINNTKEVQKLGQRYRDTILSQGGGDDPMEIFKAFRGREPDPTALLKQRGLLLHDNNKSQLNEHARL